MRQQFCSRLCSNTSRQKENQRHRKSGAYNRWRRAVVSRDGGRCRRCGGRGQVHAHHLRSWAENPDLRFDIDNGVTLCVECHEATHGRALTRRS